MEITQQTLAQRSHSALQNVTLQLALKRATGRFVELRRKATANLPEWEELRERARQIKEHTLNHLDYYLEQLAERVTALGGKVYWASTGEDVCHYINQLACSRGVKTAVKSKSMATEEVELNQALEAAGVRPVETDLGEYIIQLARERPTHIIAPAIHKTREQIGDLFADKLQVMRTEVVEELTAIAREKLRNEFLSAEMGITGVNFAIAETGTIVLVENEGNIRLSTQLPPLHVALMGIEKVIPRFADLAVFLRLLPRSATGQLMSSYVSFITGPKRLERGRIEPEFHLVIMDNGRTRMLADEKMRESLYCIRCGACLNVCPVYQKIGGQAYGWIYPGPIGAVITPQLQSLQKASELPFASSLCGACKDACPVKINLPDLLLQLRHQVNSTATTTTKLDAQKLGERLAMRAYSVMVRHPKWFAAAGRVMRKLAQILADGGKITHSGVPPLKEWTDYRDFPAPAGKSFRERWQEQNEQ